MQLVKSIIIIINLIRSSLIRGSKTNLESKYKKMRLKFKKYYKLYNNLYITQNKKQNENCLIDNNFYEIV